MDTALVPTFVDEPMDFTVIAKSPSEMEAAQRSLILWAARKIQFQKQEIAEAEEQLRIAKERKWETAAWRKEVTKRENQANYFRKIKAALEAGYYIVPPFPIDIFAIRTDRKAPRHMTGESRDNHDQLPSVLPIGEGRYVDPKPTRESYVEVEKRQDYKTNQMVDKNITYYHATGFEDVTFPFKLARAEVKEAAINAMGLKIFDTLGVLPRTRKPDPVVCGQIYVPNKKLWRHYEVNEAVTFFVAWWLDTKLL